GVLVNNILDTSPAKGRLMSGDIITKINNKTVRNISDFSACIEQFPIGEIIKIYFQRNKSLYSTKIPIIDISMENSKEKKSGVGLFLTKGEIQCQFPLEVIINLDGIKGSSAGLMIALEILNQLTENDLSNGLIIAGTGILDIDGNIKPVDGIKQKVISAKKNKSDVFFIPKQNYQEAARYNKNIKIIPVENFDEVIMKLIKL
ncbi:MAG: S16 family serine protease, partial [Candidatus Caldatribacteriota bacterium]|nr:S16 family serine protease [Candidatus Caldatribacteriota bacterium]